MPRNMFALAGLVLATGGVFFSDSLSTLSKNGSDKISIFIHVYVYVYFLTPITFYLSILSLFLHATAHADTLEPSILVFLKQYLSRAAGIVSLANLLSFAPLLVHVSVAEQRVGFAIGAAPLLLSLVFIFAFVFKKILVSSCQAGRGFMPVFFALCISSGTFFISFESIFKFDKRHHSLVPFIPIQLLFSLISFFLFVFGITLLIICIVNASAGGSRVPIPIRVQNLLISALCVTSAMLIVVWYMKIYMILIWHGICRRCSGATIKI